MYYSKLVVSSGDSMAREGAMLGVPSIYCGLRDMKANKLLMELGSLQHLPQQQAVPLINKIIETDFNQDQQCSLRNSLLNSWDDMIVFMKEKINQYKN
jgi:predicted glycosyltransferase